MDILTQLNKAIIYIEENIDCDLTLADVSKATVYSKFHFCQLFNYIAGMSLSEYIRKRKLSLAAMELQSSDIKIMDLAVKYGYDSADSFARAFSKQHGVAPSVARRSGITLKIFPTMTFQIKIGGVQGMNWRIEEKDAFKVVGIYRRFASDDTDSIAGFWREKMEDGSIQKLCQQVDGGNPMGICGHVNNDANDFLYMIGLFADDNTDTTGFTTITAPASTWAVFRSEEFKENQYGGEIPKLFDCAFKEWLPSSGYEKIEGSNEDIYDMEMYECDGAGRYYEEVWLSVVKK